MSHKVVGEAVIVGAGHIQQCGRCMTALLNILISAILKLKFIDVINDEIENYPEALNILRSGYGVAKFHGGIPYEAVYNEIQKCL